MTVWLSLAAFAQLAGVSRQAAHAAARCQHLSAAMRGRHIALNHDAALAYMAAHPLTEPSGDATLVRAALARIWGRVPTAAEAARAWSHLAAGNDFIVAQGDATTAPYEGERRQVHDDQRDQRPA